MTAYGRGTSTFAYGRFTVEIQSVNRRFLDFNINLPRLLSRFEEKIRKVASAQVGRGMVNISVTWRFESKQPFSVVPNLPLARELKNAWEKLSLELGLEGKIDLALLAEQKEILIYEEELENEEVVWEGLNKALLEALAQFSDMKTKEGSFLAGDLRERVLLIEECMNEIEKHSSTNPDRFRQKLSQRLEEFFTGDLENKERVLKEVFIFAEKIDVTEEIVRFKSHLVQFRELLQKPLVQRETRGKTLEFLIQELNREINTIGAKNLDATAAQKVVIVKSELEKMREQIQNVE